LTCEATNPDLVIDDDHELTVPTAALGRAVPVATPESAPFWTGLARGEIVLLRCHSCTRLTYLASPGCPWCGGADVAPEAVDGTGTLYSFTVCYTEFGPGLEAPYVVGIVAPTCEPEVRIVTNIVGCRVRDVRMGAAVTPCIVPTESGHLLLYRLLSVGGSASGGDES
jgi:uncharacterized OB-fold protein